MHSLGMLGTETEVAGTQFATRSVCWIFRLAVALVLYAQCVQYQVLFFPIFLSPSSCASSLLSCLVSSLFGVDFCARTKASHEENGGSMEYEFRWSADGGCERRGDWCTCPVKPVISDSVHILMRDTQFSPDLSVKLAFADCPKKLPSGQEPRKSNSFNELSVKQELRSLPSSPQVGEQGPTRRCGTLQEPCVGRSPSHRLRPRVPEVPQCSRPGRKTAKAKLG